MIEPPEQVAENTKYMRLANFLSERLSCLDRPVIASEVLRQWQAMKEDLAGEDYPPAMFDFAGFSTVVDIFIDASSYLKRALQNARLAWYDTQNT